MVWRKDSCLRRCLNFKFKNIRYTYFSYSMLYVILWRRVSLGSTSVCGRRISGSNPGSSFSSSSSSSFNSGSSSYRSSSSGSIISISSFAEAAKIRKAHNKSIAMVFFMIQRRIYIYILYTVKNIKLRTVVVLIDFLKKHLRKIWKENTSHLVCAFRFII